MSRAVRPNCYLLRRGVVAARLDAAHLRHADLARQVGLSRAHFSQLVNGHRPLSPRVRRALLDHPIFAGVAEGELWDVLPPRFEQLALPCLTELPADDTRGAA